MTVQPEASVLSAAEGAGTRPSLRPPYLRSRPGGLHPAAPVPANGPPRTPEKVRFRRALGAAIRWARLPRTLSPPSLAVGPGSCGNSTRTASSLSSPGPDSLRVSLPADIPRRRAHLPPSGSRPARQLEDVLGDKVRWVFREMVCAGESTARDLME